MGAAQRKRMGENSLAPAETAGIIAPDPIGYVGPDTVIFYPAFDPIPARRDSDPDVATDPPAPEYDHASETPVTRPAPRTRRYPRIDRASRQVAQLALVVIALLTAGGAWWLFAGDDHSGNAAPAAPAFTTTQSAAVLPATPFPAPAPAPAPSVDVAEPVASDKPTVAPEAPAPVEPAAPTAAPTAEPVSDQPMFNGRPIRPVRTIRMLVTAYSPDARSCGKFADNITASGYSVWTNGMKLVAADKMFKFGTILTVKGYNDGQPVPVLDRGGAIKGNRLDVLYPTHEIARKWGKQHIDVVVWEYAD